MYVCMYVCMDVWMYGCMDVWMYGCMDGWMYYLVHCFVTFTTLGTTTTQMRKRAGRFQGRMRTVTESNMYIEDQVGVRRGYQNE